MTSRYWCYQCDRAYTYIITEDITQCTQCNCEFIEKLEHQDFQRNDAIQIQVPPGVNISPESLEHIANFIRFAEDRMILNMVQDSQMDQVLEESLNDPPPQKKVCKRFISTLEEIPLSDTCTICQDTMGEIGYKLPCGHIFHKDCLLQWFDNQNTCPECRHEFPEETKEEEESL